MNRSKDNIARGAIYPKCEIKPLPSFYKLPERQRLIVTPRVEAFARSFRGIAKEKEK